MAKNYTVAVVLTGGEIYEALYSDGRLIATGDSCLSAEEVLQAIATDNIAVQASMVEVDPVFDENVIAPDGWPERLEDVETVEMANARLGAAGTQE